MMEIKITARADNPELLKAVLAVLAEAAEATQKDHPGVVVNAEVRLG